MRTHKWETPTKLDSMEIQRFQRILEAQRDEALRSLNRLGDDARNVESGSPHDMGDLCTATLSRESLFQQSGARRLMVRTIEAALARIQHGTFGLCVACGDEINPRRLDALPWTEFCLRCQEDLEQENRQMEHRSGWANRRFALRKAG